MQFDDLMLSEAVLRAVRDEGYTTPTPIQQRAVPPVLEGRDLLGCAQTGTGKTAAFALPLLCRLDRAPGAHANEKQPRAHRPIRVLVLAPTRELALQIQESFNVYGKHTGLRSGVIFGGVGQNPQTRMLQQGVDIVVATPGRLLDLINQGYVDLSKVKALVLDEADRMLDMGFIHDIKKIIAKLPKERQNLMFSATMPREITSLASSILRDPVRVEVAPESTTAERVTQSVYFVEGKMKQDLLRKLLDDDSAIERALVFTRTKHGADRVVKRLKASHIHAESIHGNKSQSQRQRALANFKRGSVRVLVATDIAARGLDIDEVSHVINFDLPNEPESYVHRIGRTARAGASGIAVSFCDSGERGFLRDIERTIRAKVPVSKTPDGLESIKPLHHSEDGDYRAPERPYGRGASRGGPRPDRPARSAPAGRGARPHADSRGEPARPSNHRGQGPAKPHADHRPAHSPARGEGSARPPAPHGHARSAGDGARPGAGAHGRGGAPLGAPGKKSARSFMANGRGKGRGR